MHKMIVDDRKRGRAIDWKRERVIRVREMGHERERNRETERGFA